MAIENMKALNNMLNFMAAIIIFIAVIAVIFLGCNHLRKDELPKKIIIEYVQSQDSLNNKQIVKLVEMDSLLLEVKEISNNIQDKQVQLISKEEEKSIFDKFYSIVVAVILVIAGFFGFKNITEIKQRAIEDALESSKKVAEEVAIKSSKTQFEKIFTKEYEGQITNIATDSFTKMLDEESTKLNRQISSLQNRIDKLENNPDNNQGTDDEQEGDVENNNEPINPFDSE
jgi:flagellar biosynthesis chaperone FliJ